MFESRGVWRAIFVFGGFDFFYRLLGRNNPVKPAAFGHGTEEKVCIAGEDRERGAEKITRGGGIGFLRFALLNLFHYFANVRIGRTYSCNGGWVLLKETKERDVRQIRGDADFNDVFRLMLFWRKFVPPETR